MWYAIILAMGLLDNQPMFQVKVTTEHGYTSEAECLSVLETGKIQLATMITFKGLEPRVDGQCVQLQDC